MATAILPLQFQVPNMVDSIGRHVLVTPVLQGNAHMDKYSQSTNMQMQVPLQDNTSIHSHVSASAFSTDFVR